MEEVEQELNGNLTAVKAARRVMMIDKASEAEKIPPLHMSLAVTRVLAYKILDIVQWLKTDRPRSCSEIEVVQERRLEFRFLERLVSPQNPASTTTCGIMLWQKIPKMKDWPRVVQEAAKGVQLVTADDLTCPSQDSCSQEQYLFNSVVQLQSQTKGLKCITNFAVAAMHLGIIMKVILLKNTNRQLHLCDAGTLGRSRL